MERKPRSEIVLVPVPEEHLAAVYETLTREMRRATEAQQAGPPGPPGSGRPPATSSPSNPPWRLEELRRLKEMLATRPIAKALLDITAANPGLPITFSDLCDQVGASRGKARGELASLTILLKKFFGRDYWPVEVERVDGRWRYFMTVAMSALWVQS
jgi:hypothetical protein